MEGLAEDPKPVLAADKVVSPSLAKDRTSGRLLGKGNLSMSILHGDQAPTSGDTDFGTLEQYQRHITIESMMGNAYTAPQSSHALKANSFGLPAHLVCLRLQDGYKFGTDISLVGLITVNYAKLLNDRHLWESSITLNYAYLS